MRAADLVTLGYCSPPCLLAMEGGGCRCRCEGRFHALLADAELDVDVSDVEPSRPAVIAPAPTFDCGICGRKIGKARGHIYIPDLEIITSYCCVKGSTKALHARLWPECPHRWHDFYDHPSSQGTRAGVAARVGVWP